MATICIVLTEVTAFISCSYILIQEVVEEYDSHWIARTLRTRELPGTSTEEVMKVRLTREDLVNLANQGLAYIEQRASEASGVDSSKAKGKYKCVTPLQTLLKACFF